MEILDLPHLPESLHPQLPELTVLNGDPPQDIRFVREFVALAGFDNAPYYGVYAVEEGEILAKVEVVHPRFTWPGRPAVRLAGIADVFTRAEALRHGYARDLLQEVHRREAEAGIPWSLLWTQASWGAHRLYEELGYADVYRPWTAIRFVAPARDRPALARGPFRSARASEVPLVERIRARGARGRVGFAPAFPRGISTLTGLGVRSPTDFRILRCEGRDVGFALLEVKKSYVSARDVVVTSGRYAVPMLEALERVGRGRWLILDLTTFVRDHADLLKGRGYRVHVDSHRRLMARRLDPAVPADLGAVCGDARFMCLGFDRF